MTDVAGWVRETAGLPSVDTASRERQKHRNWSSEALLLQSLHRHTHLARLKNWSFNDRLVLPSTFGESERILITWSRASGILALVFWRARCAKHRTMAQKAAALMPASKLTTVAGRGPSVEPLLIGNCGLGLLDRLGAWGRGKKHPVYLSFSSLIFSPLFVCMFVRVALPLPSLLRMIRTGRGSPDETVMFCCIFEPDLVRVPAGHSYDVESLGVQKCPTTDIHDFSFLFVRKRPSQLTSM
ncbi:hypothetical protein QBC46DRAFT_399078 [Diplogelasinospora grovesii]|uniref:Uncharacterized protein n=1 Tax=Diplogelasinospora grovesii TaxID=303347 RepID=A0AAN6RZD5_9PEZI|nr:hypothetical protein QBC46DRAFT_399078 [Diplogelasinospora grovesii]